jgi:hypothetical protein
MKEMREAQHHSAQKILASASLHGEAKTGGDREKEGCKQRGESEGGPELSHVELLI